MTIHHNNRRPRISDREAKKRIRAIEDANPAIRSSVDDLVAHDTRGTVIDKRNRAIFAVYLRNAIFRDAVDAELAR